MKLPHLLIILSFLIIHSPKTSSSHSGGLASDGCHFNHKLGTRHCHRGKDESPTNDVNISGAKVYVYNPDLLGNIVFKDFSSAKKELWKIYEKNPKTFYCGCEFTNEKPVHESCGFLSFSPLAYKIEWEHIVPLSHLSENTPAFYRGEFMQGSELCEDGNGKKYRGRRCASEIDNSFKKMESDLYNLVPVIGIINRVRSNYHFGEVPEEVRQYGQCDFEIGEVLVKRKKVKRVEPREDIRGDIARTHIYMTRIYRSEYQMWNQERELMMKWDKLDPPDNWECERGQLIELIQGNRNPVLYSRCYEVKKGW